MILIILEVIFELCYDSWYVIYWVQLFYELMYLFDLWYSITANSSKNWGVLKYVYNNKKMGENVRGPIDVHCDPEVPFGSVALL
jgi:hypothetical protein